MRIRFWAFSYKLEMIDVYISGIQIGSSLNPDYLRFQLSAMKITLALRLHRQLQIGFLFRCNLQRKNLR